MDKLMQLQLNKTITVAPGPPVLFVGSGVDHNQVKIQIAPFNNSGVEYVDHFQFWYYRHGWESITLENETISTDNSVTYTSVKPGDLYYYHATAVRNNVSSIPSRRQYRTPPSPIIELNVLEVTNSSFLLNWTLPDSEISTYNNIEIYEAGTKIVTLSKNTNEYRMENYVASHMASLQVFTVTGEPFPAKSVPKIVSVLTKPARVDPETIEIKQIGDKVELRLTWKKPSGYFNGYTVTVQYHAGSKMKDSAYEIAFDKLEYVLKRPQHDFLMPGMAYKGTGLYFLGICGFYFLLNLWDVLDLEIYPYLQ